MNCRRYIRKTVAQAATLLLLAALLLAGPVSPAAPLHALEQEACGSSCPCEEPPAETSVTIHHTCCGPAETADPAAAPVDEHCPPDCQDCNCCTGLVMALLPTAEDSPPERFTSDGSAMSYQAPVSGHPSGIFKPPRSFT